MAEDHVNVKFGADTSGFHESMNQLRFTLEGLTNPIRAVRDNLGELAEAFLAAFAVEKLVEGIKQITEASTEFGMELLRVQTLLGSTSQEAARVSEGMKLLGSSGDAYTGSLFKLQRQIKANESAVNALGVATRDSNGNTLSATQLMNNARETLLGYKEGADRNAASLYLFGRSAEDVIPILMLNNELMDKGSQILKDLGVDTTPGAVNAAHEFEVAQNSLSETFHQMAVKVGQELSPSLTALFETVQQVAIPVFTALNAVLKVLIATIDALFVGVANSFRVIKLAVQEVSDLESLDFKSMKSHWNDSLDAMTESGKAFVDRMDALFSGVGTNQHATLPGGSKNFVDPVQAEQARKLQEKIDKEDAAARQRAMDQETRALVKANADKLKADEAYYGEVEALIKQKRAAGELSIFEEAHDLQRAETEKYNSQVHQLQQSQQLYAKDEAEWEHYQQQIEKAAADHAKKLVQIQTQAAKEVAQQWQQYAKPIEQGFSNAITGMIFKTQTFQQAMYRMGQQMVSTMVNKVIQTIVEEWIIGEAVKLMATQTTQEEMLTSQAAAEAAGHASHVAAAVADITTNAAVAASGAASSVSAIPFVGWMMAPGVAAETFAATEAWVGPASLDVGAWEIPHDMPANVHAGETVLPKTFAQGFRDAMSGGGGGSGGGEVHVHIHAVDAQSFQTFLKNPTNAKALTGAVTGYMSNNPSSRPSY